METMQLIATQVNYVGDNCSSHDAIGIRSLLKAIQFGDEHPSATVVGNDLSPIQPDWVPPNVKFVVDDVEMGWVEPIQYDYIYCRYLAGSIKDWPKLFKQASQPRTWKVDRVPGICHYRVARNH
ncbi:hypothetical protein CDV36_016620, partial [Fusarium kuroshium]